MKTKEQLLKELEIAEDTLKLVEKQKRHITTIRERSRDVRRIKEELENLV